MIELIATDILFMLNAVLLFLVVILAVKLADCGTRLNRVEESCDVLENVAEGLSDRCDTHNKSLEYLSKSVRELNGVVEAAVKVKEQTSDNKPDVEALIGGWMTDDGSTEIDASHIRTGMIDGKSVMNCELPYISESAREKIFEMLGVKVPEEELKLTAYSMDRALGRTVSGDVVWMDKRGHVNYGAYGD